MPARKRLFRVVSPFVAYKKGKRVGVYNVGPELYEEDDPAVLAYPGSFAVVVPIERATAAPGEVHKVHIPKPSGDAA